MVSRVIVEEPIRFADKGHPLGDGCGLSDRWRAILRCDGCSYCGGSAETVDHVEPRRGGKRGIGSANNLTGACADCNLAKGHNSLLLYLLERVNSGEQVRA
jgi:HNH endonuclease